MKKKLKIFCVGDRKKVFQFKVSTPMVGHIGKGQSCWNLFYHNFATNCDTDTNIKKIYIYLLFICYLIGLFIVRCEKKPACYFKKCGWPWTMEWFIEILTNQSCSFFLVARKSSNFCIILIINFYECNYWLF